MDLLLIVYQSKISLIIFLQMIPLTFQGKDENAEYDEEDTYQQDFFGS